jgi:hypothetical protein
VRGYTRPGHGQSTTVFAGHVQPLPPCRGHRDGRAHASRHGLRVHGCTGTVVGRLLITCVPRSRHATTKLNFKRRAFKPCSLSSSSPVRSFNEHEPLLLSKAGRVVTHEVTLTNLLLSFHKFMRSWRVGQRGSSGTGAADPAICSSAWQIDTDMALVIYDA